MKYPHLGILLAVIFLSASCSFAFTNLAFAQTSISAKSIGFEETTIIEFSNNGSTDVKTFRLWLGSDFNFKSFKTENGWTGTKTPEGVLVFTTSSPVKPGESIKFGVKTDKPKPGINWKALDKNENQIEIGKTDVSESSSIVTSNPENPKTTPNTPVSTSGILEKSSFRLVPEKPNAGGTVRVIGESFASNQKLDLYIDDIKLDSIQTDGNGNFLTTTKIPTQKADRVNFIVKDKQGNERTVSIRLSQGEERLLKDQVVELTVNEFPTIMHRGETVTIKGIGNPGGTITAKITNPDGTVVTTNASSISSEGKWSYQTVVPLDSQLGQYSAEISDGKDTITKKWTLESAKKILILPTKIKFEPGDIMSFNGTVIPNQKLEVVLENPLGVEVFSDIINVGDSGEVSFDYKTELSTLEGTYVLFASQGKESNIALVGLGELPEVQLLAKLDKLNYKTGEKASVTLTGPPSSTISFIVVDPSDKTKFADTITLDPDGKKDYQIDLSGYSSGVYTLVIQRGNAQAAEVFTVGLQTGSGKIDVRSTKTEYLPGNSILILGNSGSNILATLSLIDPDGKVIKTKETFTNKEGLLSESSFRIPSDAKSGTWTIRAESGSNFSEYKISVAANTEEDLGVVFDGIVNDPQLGKVVKLHGYGASSGGGIKIKILNKDGVSQGSELSFPAKSNGEFSTQWTIPSDMPSGTYTIQASDPFKTVETKFQFTG